MVLGVAGVAIALNVSRKPLPVPCQTVAARTILTPTVTRTARGAYVVTATGTTVNQSPGARRDLVVLWAVTYADGATGRPTATSLATTGVIARGATLSWRATASSGDGAARPIGITVLHTVTTAAHPTCLT